MIRALAVAIGVALLVPALAFAKPRVAIVAFEGDTQGALQDVVVEALEGAMSLVGPRQVTRAMDKLELDVDMSAKQLKKLANELEADAIVRGDVSPKGARKVLHIRLFLNGKRIRGFRVEYGSAKSAKFKEALRDKLFEKLGVDAPKKKKQPVEDEATDEGDGEEPKGKGKKGKKGGGDEADAEETVAKGKGKKGKKADEAESEGEGEDGESTGDDEEDPNAGKKTAAAGDEDDEEIDEVGDVEESVTVEGKGRSANRAAVRVDFGPSMSSRNLSFSSRSFEEAPRPYSNTPVAGGRVEGELYPLALSNPYSIISGIGIGGEYDQTVGLNLQTTVQPGTKFPVTQKHFSVGGRLRLVFGKKPTSPSVTLQGGYMSRMFKVDRSKLVDNNIIDLPDVGYKGYNAGADVRFPVGAKVAILAGGRAIFVTTTGAIQTGAQYGQAKVTGAEGQVGVDIGIGKRMAVRVMGEGTQMGFAFTGTGQMANNRDGDPTTKDVGGAADRYLGASLTFGVMY